MHISVRMWGACVYAYAVGSVGAAVDGVGVGYAVVGGSDGATVELDIACILRSQRCSAVRCCGMVLRCTTLWHSILRCIPFRCGAVWCGAVRRAAPRRAALRILIALPVVKTIASALTSMHVRMVVHSDLTRACIHTCLPMAWAGRLGPCGVQRERGG